MEQSEPDAICRRAVDGETLRARHGESATGVAFFAARFDPDAFMPGDGVAHAGLRLSRRDAAALTGYSFQRIQQLAHDSE